MNKINLDKFKEKINYQERIEHIIKNPLWKQFYIIWDNIINQNFSVDKAVEETLKLSYKFLKINNNDELREIIISFENLKDLILYVYGKEFINKYEDSKEYELLSYFDSLILDYDFQKEMIKLKNDLSQYYNNLK